MLKSQPKLNFRNISSAVGREAEEDILTKALREVLEVPADPVGPQCVFLEGASGSGKTYLVEQWRRKQADTFLFGSGKFDQSQQSAVPYSALVEAVSNLEKRLIPEETLTTWKETLHHEEVDLLVSFFPSLDGILGRSGQERDADVEAADLPSTSCIVDKKRKVTQRRKKPPNKQRSLSGSLSKLKVSNILSMGRKSFIRYTGSGSSRDVKKLQEELSQITLEAGNEDNADEQSENVYADEQSENVYHKDVSAAFRNKSPAKRLSYILGEFLSCLTTDSSLILFVDDVQWADKSSLDLFLALLANAKLSQVLIILASRPATGLELDGSERRLFLDVIRTSMDSSDRVLRHIPVAGITVQACTKIISSITEAREELCLELAAVVHQKTGGNPYFVLRSLESLHRRRLLLYDMQQYRWTWDVLQIKAQTDLAENVAAGVRETITEVLHEEALETLRVASRLGFTFDREDLLYVIIGIQHFGSHDPSEFLLQSYSGDKGLLGNSGRAIQEKIDQQMKSAVEESIISHQGGGSYKFSHDQILQCFMAMPSPTTTKQEEDIQLGVLLVSLFWLRRKIWALFAGLRLLRRHYGGLSQECRAIMIKENATAAEQAFLKSAFDDAAEYACASVDLLRSIEENPWEGVGKKFCWEIHVMASSYLLVCGKHDFCKELAETIISNTDDFDQQVDAYFVLASSFRNQSKPEESNSYLIEALKQMGEKVPTSKPHIIQRAFSPKRGKAGKLAEDQILELPLMYDVFDKRRMKFLSTLYLNSYDYLDKLKMKYAADRMLAITLNAGLCKQSSLALAAHAQNMAIQGDFIEGSRYGAMALKLVQKLGAIDNLPLVTFFLVTCVNHLRTPLFKSLSDLKRGYQTGMEHGDIQAAFLCATTDVSFQFLIASPLADNVKSCSDYFLVAHEYGLVLIQHEILALWQLAINFSCSCSATDSTELNPFDGKAMGQTSVMQDAKKNGSGIAFYINYLKSLGDLYFGLWEEAEEVLLGVFNGYVAKDARSSHYSTAFICIYTAVTCFKMYSKTKNKKSLAAAEKASLLLKGWVEKGGINVAGGLSLAEAQKAAINKPFDSVKDLFDTAIVGLHRCGLRNLEALACVNFAEVALENGDNGWASDYFLRAYQIYTDWGATAVAANLKTRHGSLFDA